MREVTRSSAEGKPAWQAGSSIHVISSFFFISFIKAKGAETKGEDGATGEAKGSEGTSGEAKGSDGTTEDTGGGTKEDTGGTTKDAEDSAKAEGENQPKNEEEAEGCCCILI